MTLLQDEPKLPENWIWSTVGELYDIVGGGTPSTSVEEYWSGKIPWITSADIHGPKDIRPRKTISEKAVANSTTNLVPKESLIVVTRVGLGKVAIAQERLCFSQDSQALIGSGDFLDPRFALYYLSMAVQIFKYQNRGTTIAGVTKQQLAELPFPVAPLSEQRRIVAKIEELFTQLDAGVEELRKAQAQLKRYRQAVLKAGITGELTREWRLVQKGEQEPASELLARILKERRARWEKERLAKITASSKTPNTNDWRNTYEERAAPAVENLPPLPFGWVWSSLGQVFGVHVGATPSRQRSTYWNGDLPWVSSSEVAFCRIKSTRETITELGFQNTSTDLHPVGTVLLGMIGEGKTRGQAAILDIAACNSQNSAAIRVSEAGLPPEYIYYFLQGEYERTRKLGSGNNQPALNKSRVQAIVFALPPLSEQYVIVQELERLLSIADAVQQSIEKELNKAASLRHSILKRAFEGELVSQDPNDEPAELLLERIRMEREKQEAEKQSAANLNRKRLTKNRSKRTERPAA